MRWLLRLVICLGAAAAPAWAQDVAQRSAYDTPEGAAQGATLFQTRCAFCHGARGEGGRGTDLTSGQYAHGGSDAELYSTIRNGVPGTERFRSALPTQSLALMNSPLVMRATKAFTEN